MFVHPPISLSLTPATTVVICFSSLRLSAQPKDDEKLVTEDGGGALKGSLQVGHTVLHVVHAAHRISVFPSLGDAL